MKVTLIVLLCICVIFGSLVECGRKGMQNIFFFILISDITVGHYSEHSVANYGKICKVDKLYKNRTLNKNCNS